MSHLRDSEMSVGQPGFIEAERENKEQAVVPRLRMQVPITVSQLKKKDRSANGLMLNFER